MTYEVSARGAGRLSQIATSTTAGAVGLSGSETTDSEYPVLLNAGKPPPVVTGQPRRPAKFDCESARVRRPRRALRG